jgi:hypothetical protein
VDVCGKHLMSRLLIAALVVLITAAGAQAQTKGKGIRFWNLTTATVSGLQLSPAGRNEWGPNQTLNDKDKEVDHDDAKVSYHDARQCVVRDIDIKADAVFSIADKDLKDCSK